MAPAVEKLRLLLQMVYEEASGRSDFSFHPNLIINMKSLEMSSAILLKVVINDNLIIFQTEEKDDV